MWRNSRHTYRDFSWKFHSYSMSFGLSFAWKASWRFIYENKSCLKADRKVTVENKTLDHVLKVLRSLNGFCILDSLSLNKWTLSTSIVRLVLTVGPMDSMQYVIQMSPLISCPNTVKSQSPSEFKWQSTIGAKAKVTTGQLTEVMSDFRGYLIHLKGLFNCETAEI